MQTAPQLQAKVGTQGQGIGTYLQLLHPGDTRVGIVQIGRTNPAPGQQLRVQFGLVGEALQDQGNHVQGGQRGVQHDAFRERNYAKERKKYAVRRRALARPNGSVVTHNVVDEVALIRFIFAYGELQLVVLLAQLEGKQEEGNERSVLLHDNTFVFG